MSKLVSGPKVSSGRVSALRIPTEQPESDGTAEWDSTTVVLVELAAGGFSGLGYSYANQAAANVAQELIGKVVIGKGSRVIRGHQWSIQSQAMRIAQGEYIYVLKDAYLLLKAQPVDVLRADVTCCGGITNCLKIGHTCEISHIPYSAHTCPSVHASLCCVVNSAINVEYFHDHARIEHMFFDNAVTAKRGKLKPDLSRTGFGLKVKRRDAEKSSGIEATIS